MTNFSNNTDSAIMACERYERMVGASNLGRGYRRINLMMDLTAADGVNGNRHIDWAGLLAADDFNFMHDVGGISRNIDRATGAIGNHFLHRFARNLIAA